MKQHKNVVPLKIQLNTFLQYQVVQERLQLYHVRIQASLIAPITTDTLLKENG
ncbi:hypothetical protein FF38_10475 [Lucilia cuprina]|uniref:Uncharacterized protein n=1 Tax=Lucilia cuprina TaxID=7375 RepID=A0A0L0CJN7_LUCCU|nr:hypothetical protein FF38_10475 [Lucilia cuprina]